MTLKVAVVLPCFNVRSHILGVIEKIGPEVSSIYVVDDQCPESTGSFVAEQNKDTRVKVIKNPKNLGVGGAVMAGYQAAIADDADIIVKIDGDGQMDPALLPQLIAPIVEGRADYCKGNRFYDLEHVRQMPKVRLFGNAALSLMSKLSTGYWGLFDPTNGYTAIHARVAAHLPLQRISQRYFFETDILFRLNTLRAVVCDVPMHACYGDEVSGLKISKILPEFLLKHTRNFIKRFFYNYILRDMSLASLELVVGLTMLLFGTIYGGIHWYESSTTGTLASPGTIMIASLPIISGVQFILAFFAYDIAREPTNPIAGLLFDTRKKRAISP
ncbi:glycosyltransferase family 2 protein [Pseudomonas sp. TTU2014-080ASC]|jgi:dolichol-phosphate mannosyltransferase|uniref:glycosyltransferase family 2 protein n=1 Tax=Pseudomonas sp. TTU2014-080ASC TaxID=1729724 RepID=UPI00071859C2|nr:glycosyltransferase family 2 protein [Pseudomonas sp. TTU2014-080ASC]KRW60860.1 glycosyl transferase family 2 [Pseudomonas sp. TTU2014-080ASC]